MTIGHGTPPPKANIEGFSSQAYWSSTQVDENNAKTLLEWQHD